MNLIKGLFITGTDTGIGKTEVTLALMAAYQRRGKSVVGMKPVASGASSTAEGVHNGDALRLQQQGSVLANYDTINPYCFVPPIAPHLAAEQAGVVVSFEQIELCLQQLAQSADIVLVEGVGGWRVPLSEQGDVGALANYLGLPVLMVVGLRLGCISHARLTAEAMVASGCHCLGWIANQLEPDMVGLKQNIATLQQLLPFPMLGSMEYNNNPADIHLDIGESRLPFDDFQ